MYKDKLTWVKSLSVGDTVQDCRFLNSKIVSIHEEYIVRYPQWLVNFVYAYWMPIPIEGVLEYVLSFFFRKRNNLELVDKSLTFEDGRRCSAMSCCDPVVDEIIKVFG
jgi:hypothetical protein